MPVVLQERKVEVEFLLWASPPSPNPLFLFGLGFADKAAALTKSPLDNCFLKQ